MDPYQVKLNTVENPDRSQEFDDALEMGKAQGAPVLRGLVDAYIAFVREHGKLPSFPVRLTSADEDPKLREQSPLYKARPKA